MPMSANIFQLIDFDRTLFDTTLLIKKLLAYIAQSEPEISNAIRAESDAAYKEERTFLLLGYLREQYGDAWLDEAVDAIVREQGSERFMIPGARERLAAADSLTSARPAWGVLTYGDVVDQRMKLRIAGLENEPVLIVDTSNKGALISSWATPEGKVRLPAELGGSVVDGVTLEDDKLRVFEGAPQQLIAGVWVTAAADAQERLEESKLTHVSIANSLHESLALLRTRLRP